MLCGNRESGYNSKFSKVQLMHTLELPQTQAVQMKIIKNVLLLTLGLCVCEVKTSKGPCVIM